MHIDYTSSSNVSKEHIKLCITCPTTETPNESTSYTIPFQGPGMTAGYAKFYVFLRDVTTGGIINMQLKNPNGTVYTATGNPWSYTLPSTNLYYTLSYSKKLPIIAGTYTFEASYNGITCSQSFDIITSTGVEETNNLAKLDIYPNPTSGSLTVSGNELMNGDYHLTLKNAMGQLLEEKQIKIVNNTIQKSFLINDLANGIYFLSLQSTKTSIVKKISKQND